MNYFTTFKTKLTNKVEHHNKLFIKITFSIIVFTLMIILAIYPDLFLKSFLDGLILFATAVLPSLFPFMFLTKSLTDLGLVQTLVQKMDKPFFAIFRAPAIGLYIFFMSAICGYPVGAKLLSDLTMDGTIDKAQAESLLPFCSTSGPLFVVGSVGVGMFDNKLLGFAVFGVHLAACLICALILGWSKKLLRKERTLNATIKPSNVPLDTILSKNMTDTCSSILLVGGFIATFYLFIDILSKFKILLPLEKLFSYTFTALGLEPNFAIGISSGMVEMTRGCRDLSFYTGNFLGVALSAIITFSGLSILAQSWAFLSKAKIPFGKFFAIKIFQTLIAILLAIPIFLL